MDITAGVIPELDLTSRKLLDRGDNFHRHRSVLRRWHLALRTKRAT